jgi:hypothetical protein
MRVAIFDFETERSAVRPFVERESAPARVDGLEIPSNPAHIAGVTAAVGTALETQ